MEKLTVAQIDAWVANCKTFDANRVGIGFRVDCNVADDGTVHIKLANFGKYRKSMPKLEKMAYENCQMALLWFLQSSRHLAPQKAVEAAVKENAGGLFSVLLKDGIEAFFHAAELLSSLLEIRQEMAEIRLVDGSWTLGNGYAWDGECFRNGDSFLVNNVTPVWETIFDKAS